MNALNRAIKGWEEHREQNEEKQNSIIRAIFLTCPNIKNFELAYKNKHKGNSLSSAMAFIVSVNDTPTDEDLMLKALIFFTPENDAFKSWMITANITSEDFATLALGLNATSREYLCYYKWRREDFLED